VLRNLFVRDPAGPPPRRVFHVRLSSTGLSDVPALFETMLWFMLQAGRTSTSPSRPATVMRSAWPELARVRLQSLTQAIDLLPQSIELGRRQSGRTSHLQPCLCRPRL
jgi:hypothetical protein